VLGIARRWQDVDARFFQVRLEDGDRYVLRHDERSDEWSVVEVQRPADDRPAHCFGHVATVPSWTVTSCLPSALFFKPSS
jgi:hypothetical protein